jgi:molybdenum cofactor cytidylyltransferase
VSARVSGVVLAAGLSSRLNQPKQLLLLDGEPIVRVVVRNAISSRLGEVILVIGAHASEVEVAAGFQGQQTVLNPRFAEGQSTSVHAGLEAVSPDADGVLFLLGDQPEVGSDVIDAVIGAFERTGAPIVQPVYGGTPANPVLFARPLFAELRSLSGDAGARSIVRARTAEVDRVPVSDGFPPGDVDTNEDYQALLQRWQRRSTCS